MTSKRNGTLYVGITNDILRRVQEHRNESIEGFTKEYHLHQLVYYEQHEDPESAIRREKQIKEWQRSWKLRLIEGKNPEWKDLYFELVI